MSSRGGFTGSWKPGRSSPCISPNTRWHHSPSPQVQSTFFATLPLEIRDLIYLEVIGTLGHVVALFRDYDRSKGYDMKLRATPFREKSANTERANTELATRNRTFGTSTAKNSGQINTCALNWLLSCQKIYAEAFHLLYSVPTISIRDTCTFDSWWASLPPHSFKKVHSLHLEWMVPCAMGYASRGERAAMYRMTLDEGRWNSLWETVAAMRGLESLHLELTRLPQMSFSEEETNGILEPLKNMKRLREFTVSVDWYLSNKYIEDYIEDVPFNLVCTSSPPSTWGW